MSSERLDFALAFLNLPDQDAEAVLRIARSAGVGLSAELAEVLVAGAPYDAPEDAVGLRGIGEKTLEGIAAGLLAHGVRLGKPLPGDLVDRLVPPEIRDPLEPPDPRGPQHGGDGDDGDGGKVPPEPVPRAPDPVLCPGRFVSGRRNRTFYRSGSTVRTGRFRITFGDRVACDNPKILSVPESTTIPIYWSILSRRWGRGQAQAKLTEASRWFDQYCISLTLSEANLRRADTVRFTGQLAVANRRGIDAYPVALGRIYREIWQRRLGRPPKFLLVLFVDDYTGRFRDKINRTLTVNVAFNIPRVPIILIPAKEIPSSHVVTHELIHGLGKVSWRRVGRRGSRVVATDPYSGQTQMNNSWLEGGCRNEMGNAGRSNPSDPLPPKQLSAPMDWASYYQFWRSGSILF